MLNGKEAMNLFQQKAFIHISRQFKKHDPMKIVHRGHSFYIYSYTEKAFRHEQRFFSNSIFWKSMQFDRRKMTYIHITFVARKVMMKLITTWSLPKISRIPAVEKPGIIPWTRPAPASTNPAFFSCRDPNPRTNTWLGPDLAGFIFRHSNYYLLAVTIYYFCRNKAGMGDIKSGQKLKCLSLNGIEFKQYTFMVTKQFILFILFIPF